jgi:succinylglutamic semialdehyde dehydrogenase
MEFQGYNFMNGEWVSAAGAEFSSSNPSTGEVIWSGRESTADEIDAAISAAGRAAREWASRPLAERIQILEAFRNVLEEDGQQLADAISWEVGKPLWEARTEVQAMIGKVAVSIEALQERRSETAIELSGAQGVTRYKPHGVLTVFGPYNFPGHISNGHIVPALLAGNTVVFKPSELTPLVAELTVRFWEEAGLPTGVLNLVQGGRETGVALVAHPGHNGVLFTGSLKAGLSISRALADRPEAIVALELGGNNPLVVHDVSDIDAAVYTTIQSACITSGQRCTCARRLIVPDGNDAFLDRLAATIPQLVIGPPGGEPEPFMGPLIHARAVDNVLAEQRRLLSSGGVSLVEAKRLSDSDAFVSPGLVDATAVADRRDEEVFGPLLQLIRVPDFDSAIVEANQTQYGLVAGLLCDQRELYEQFYRDVNAGLINWNSPTTGASGKLPFGGTGRSGNHRPAGYFTIDACNVPVASLERETLSLPETLLPGVTLP